MPFGIQIEWYGNLSETQQVLTSLATLLGALVVVGLILVASAKKTPALLALVAALVVLIVGYIATSEALPDVEWARSVLLFFLFTCAITFGMQWQKKKT